MKALSIDQCGRVAEIELFRDRAVGCLPGVRTVIGC